jgi:hypothetical protein
VSAVSLGQKPTPLSTPQLDPATHLRTKTDRLHYIGRRKKCTNPTSRMPEEVFKKKRSELCSELEEFA